MSWSDSVSMVIRFIAVPYGYTLAVWSAGMLAVGRYGQPTVREVLFFVGGAVLGYLSLDLLSVWAGDSPSNGLTALPPLAVLNILPMLPPLAMAFLASKIKNRRLGFFLVGLGATIVYVAGVVVLVLLVS